ncbi:hypothetical protein BDF22DRAFT_739726 [Syncephalis plumigaleata]|nr:hypothetical protein BDF22DRAFT_739726 [Syncephalis plumigaleata]
MRPLDGTPIKLNLNPTGIIEHGPAYEGGLQAQLESLEAAKNNARPIPLAVTPNPPTPPSPPQAQPSQAVETVQPPQQLQLQQPPPPAYGGYGTTENNSSNNSNNSAGNSQQTAAPTSQPLQLGVKLS